MYKLSVLLRKSRGLKRPQINMNHATNKLILITITKKPLKIFFKQLHDLIDVIFMC